MTALAASRIEPMTTDKPTSWSWGLFPQLALTASMGLLAVGIGNRAAQSGAWWAEIFFYGGLLLVALPIGIRLLLPNAEGTERVSLVAGFRPFFFFYHAFKQKEKQRPQWRQPPPY